MLALALLGKESRITLLRSYDLCGFYRALEQATEFPMTALHPNDNVDSRLRPC